MTELLAHSPLGGSGAERWMPCPGSVGLSDGVPQDEDDNEFSGPGIAAHTLAAECLAQNHDAWQHIGRSVVNDTIQFMADIQKETIKLPFYDIDKEMADAVQTYLDAARRAHPYRNQGNTWIERSFHCPQIHELFYGTADLVHYVEIDRVLHVWDFKYGAGIVVEVKDNPQLMYYAIGALEDLDLWGEVDTVVLHIAQPRGFHFDGPLRSWAISVGDLADWMYMVLVPAMDTALTSTATASGEHCRFCPARGRKCPQLMADLTELEALVKQLKTAGKLTAAETGRILDLMIPAMIARKQALKNATGMLNAGHKVPRWKLAKARSNRVFPPGVEAAAEQKFGDAAWTEVKLKSPAQIDKLPEGTDFTKRHAFKPDAGLTVVPDTDTRPAISKETKSLFKPTRKGKKA